MRATRMLVMALVLPPRSARVGARAPEQEKLRSACDDATGISRHLTVVGMPAQSSGLELTGGSGSFAHS